MSAAETSKIVDVFGGGGGGLALSRPTVAVAATATSTTVTVTAATTVASSAALPLARSRLISFHGITAAAPIKHLVRRPWFTAWHW